MDEIDDIENGVFRNSMDFLGKVSRLQIPGVLKSVFSMKELLLGTRLQLNPKIHSPKIIGGQCRKCFVNYLDGPAEYRIDTGKKKSRFTKKLVKKARSNKRLTKYQNKCYAQLKCPLKNPLRNQVVVQSIKCKFCEKKDCRKIVYTPVQRPVVQADSENEKKKKKPKKKKDIYCGLNQTVVDQTKTPKKKKKKPETNIVIDLTSTKKKSSKAHSKVINKTSKPEPPKATIGKKTKSIINKKGDEKRKKEKKQTSKPEPPKATIGKKTKSIINKKRNEKLKKEKKQTALKALLNKLVISNVAGIKGFRRIQPPIKSVI